MTKTHYCLKIKLHNGKQSSFLAALPHYYMEHPNDEELRNNYTAVGTFKDMLSPPHKTYICYRINYK